MHIAPQAAVGDTSRLLPRQCRTWVIVPLENPWAEAASGPLLGILPQRQSSRRFPTIWPFLKYHIVHGRFLGTHVSWTEHISLKILCIAVLRLQATYVSWLPDNKWTKKGQLSWISQEPNSFFWFSTTPLSRTWSLERNPWNYDIDYILAWARLILIRRLHCTKISMYAVFAQYVRVFVGGCFKMYC